MLRVQSPDRVLGDKSKLSEPGKSHSKLAMKAAVTCLRANCQFYNSCA
jgi:hypothetical protein